MCEELLVPKQCVRKPRASKTNEVANANEDSRSKVAIEGLKSGGVANSRVAECTSRDREEKRENAVEEVGDTNSRPRSSDVRDQR